jgi:hypothetical protein
MSAANEAWIQDSLARLEQLEAQRQRLAATGRADELAEVDEEIKSLYEVLEAAAAEGAENTAAANQMPATPAPRPAWGEVPHPAFGPAPGMSSPAPAAPAMQSPFAAPAMQSPFAAPEPYPAAAAPMMAEPSFSSASYDVSSDDEPKGSGGIIAVALVGVLALGGAGYWFLGRPKPVEAPPPAPTEVQVFKAGAIPDDTQEPQVAKGGEADRTPTVTLKVPSDDNDRRRPSSSNNRPSRPDPEPAAPGKKIKVDASNDPLAGVK